jgi:hypothetical protein
MSTKRPRKLVRKREYQQAIERIRRETARGPEAVEGFEEVIRRSPEFGMSLPGRAKYFGRPFRTEAGSYLGVYTYDDEKVICLAVRKVPTGTFS